jgi:hypothetical protein
MAISPYSPTRFTKEATCLPCCEQAPTECACALMLGAGGSPGSSTPYASYEAALADLVFDIATSNGIAVDCLAWFSRAGTTPSGSVTTAATGFTLANVSECGTAYIAFTAVAGTVLTIPDGIDFLWLLKDACTGASILGGPGNDEVTIPYDGIFIFQCEVSTNTSWTVSSSADLYYLPIIAAWDDAGTTRYVDACSYWSVSEEIYPEIPVFGTPTLAQAWLDLYDGSYSPMEESGPCPFDCLGIARTQPGTLTNLSATVASGTLSVTGDITRSATDILGEGPPAIGMIFQFFMQAGEVLTIDWTADISGSSSLDGFTTPIIAATLVDESTGTPVSVDDDSDTWDSISGSGTLTITAPHTGKFVLALFAGCNRYVSGGSSTLSSTWSITSSEALTPHTIAPSYYIDATFVPNESGPPGAGTWVSDYPCAAKLNCS